MPLHISDNPGYPQVRNLYNLTEDCFTFQGLELSPLRMARIFRNMEGHMLTLCVFFSLYFVIFSSCYSKYLKRYIVKINYKIH